MIEMGIQEARTIGGLLKRIDNFSMGSLNGRIVFQKTIYFMQVFGLFLGYRFSWYHYGPYSTNLTKDGFALIDIYRQLPPLRFKKEASEKKFKDLIEFLGDRKNNADWLEILASIHFLRRLYPTGSKAKIIETVVNKQPYIQREMCEEGWEYLKKFDLIS